MNDYRALASAICLVLMGYVLYSTQLYLDHPVQSLLLAGVAAIAPALVLTNAAGPMIWLQRPAGLVLAFVAFIWPLALLNARFATEEYTVFPVLMVALPGFLLLGLAVGYIFFRKPTERSAESAATSSNLIDSLIEVPSSKSLFEKEIDSYHAEKDREHVASQLAIATALFETKKVAENFTRLPGMRAAGELADQAAGKAGVDPTVFHSQSYQEKKLDAEVAQILKRANVELDLLKEQGTYTIRVGAVSNLATRDVDEMLRFNDEILAMNRKIEAETNPDLKKIMSDTRDALLRAFETRFGPKRDGPKQDSKASFGADVG